MKERESKKRERVCVCGRESVCGRETEHAQACLKMEPRLQVRAWVTERARDKYCATAAASLGRACNLTPHLVHILGSYEVRVQLEALRSLTAFVEAEDRKCQVRGACLLGVIL